MVFQPGVFQPGVFQQGESTGLNVHETGEDVFASAGTPVVTALLSASEAGADGAAIEGWPVVIGFLAASESGADGADIVGAFGQLLASETGSDTFEGTGDSEGNPIVIPRDIADGIAYLLEIEAFDPAIEEAITLTYSTGGFVSLPTDPIANRVYDPHILVPGDYSRAMFGTGGTAGEIHVGAGVVTLKNIDSGLDALSDYAFDGRPLVIKTVSRIKPRYENAVTVFRGTMSHAEFKWGEINLLIRDRLALLDKPIQETLYAGTTVAGGMDEAEGQPEDLKGRPKPLPLGAPPNVQPVPSNVFDGIYDLGEGGLDAITAVRDKGVELNPFGTGYTTIAALRGATIPMGNWAGSLVLGKIRLGSPPVGMVTASPVKGVTAADRTAAQIARRIMLRMGLVENVDFLASDVAALDALNDAEIGYWIGAEEQTALVAISRVLNSIGATCVPDRLGVFRLQRFDAPDPEAFPAATFVEDVIIGGSQGIERLGTGDRGSGIRAWRVVINYGHNGTVMSAADLDPDALPLTDAFRAFAGEEWRKATAEDETVKVAHLLSPELSFDTYLIHEADAQAEAERRLALYGVRRERYRIEVKSFLAEPVDLNSVVELRINRFRLSAGKKFRVIGIEENFQTGNTTLDIWG